MEVSFAAIDNPLVSCTHRRGIQGDNIRTVTRFGKGSTAKQVWLELTNV
jgi:hypothetical protein